MSDTRAVPPPTVDKEIATRSPGVYRPDIDGLRAIAIVMVVGYHVGIPGFSGGFVGVDVFFAISGYLIVGQLTREICTGGRLDWMGFLVRRVSRLVPAALAMILVVLALGLLILDPISQRQSLAKSAIAAVGSGANIYFWKFEHVGYFGASPAPPPLLHMWSLSVEEQFYLVVFVGVMVIGAFCHNRRPVRPVIVGALLLATLTSIVVSVWAATPHPIPAFYLPVTRAYEFGLGGLLAVWQPTVPRRSASSLSIVGVAGLIAVSVFVLPADTFPGAWALFPVVAALAVIAGGMTTVWGGVTRIMSTTPLTRLGKWSYGWYLWHFPLLALASAWNLGTPKLLWRVLVVLGALVIAAASYRWLEKPLRVRGRIYAASPVGRSFGRPQWRVLGCWVAASAVVIGAAAGCGLAARHQKGIGVWAQIARANSDLQHLPDDCVDPADLMGKGNTRCEVTPFVAGRPSIVLWGDSHAWQYTDGLTATAGAEHVNLVTWMAPGCPPYQPSASPSYDGLSAPLREAFSICNQHNDSAILDIKAMAQAGPVRVVASARWDPYLGEAPVSLADLNPATLQGFRAASKYRLVSGLRQAVQELAARGVPTELVLASPELARAAPACVLAPYRRFDCDVSVSTLNEHQHQSNLFLRRVAAAVMPAATIVDPRPWLCSATRCAARWGDGFSYFDDDHLSGKRSLSLAPMWIPTMERLLAQAPS